MIVEGTSSKYPKFFKTMEYMTKMEVSLSTTLPLIINFLIVIRIWNTLKGESNSCVLYEQP
jgi:hypothetical protein